MIQWIDSIGGMANDIMTKLKEQNAIALYELEIYSSTWTSIATFERGESFAKRKSIEGQPTGGREQ